ncbi:MAG: cadmium-translocating P-type ATPase [Mesorhizobium sp.]|nr:MAG: cadmium-translocating P-type ATPase [Mesorhizobium sp.]RWQ26050.1 MAG: cadmium-translocating P-type ATPase [Mesorhizobium sp.]
MSCCAPGAEAALLISENAPASNPLNEMLLASRDLGDGRRQSDLSVPGVHCASCIAAVEKALMASPAVEFARVNLSMKRVTVKWRAPEGAPPDLIRILRAAGYDSHLFATESDQRDPKYSRLVRALAVAGFCAMNIMLLSVSVWSGADGGTRQAFHWISAALALPAILYSGSVFFSSAWLALRHGHTNMDVPISIGVLMAFGLSLYDTLHDGPHAYFDAATSLLFFLLIGRTLDHVMREKARSAVAGLAKLAPRGATVLDGEGRRYVPIAEIEPGASIIVAAGDRVPIDGTVTEGESDLDYSLVSGEAAPKYAKAGTVVHAGLMNLTGPLTIVTTKRAEDSFLAEMIRLMEAAEGGRARYRRIADRASAIYSPAVHLIAFLSFAGWIIATGDWHGSVTIAIAVLIITCPCALGLAVPIVQVVAARRLFEKGIMLKDCTALERLAEIDTVVFDKTGTLTTGKPQLVNGRQIDPSAFAIAAKMAFGSRHPMSEAILAENSTSVDEAAELTIVSEHPGCGLEARSESSVYRLGRPDWALGREAPIPERHAFSVSLLVRDGSVIARFVFEDRIRLGARSAVSRLQSEGIAVAILSGDRKPVVRDLAAGFGIDSFLSGMLPSDKVDRIAALTTSESKVLMVGDGLNDAPAFAVAHASMAPATAADIGRNAADFVFLHENLSAVTDALEISRNAGTLIRQNFALAIGYNVIAIPIAVSGYVTPLLAAAAMSLSSIVVVGNAMRLGHLRTAARPRDGQAVSARPRLSSAEVTT